MSPAATRSAQQKLAPYRLLPRLNAQAKELLAQRELLFGLLADLGSPLNLVLPEVFAHKHKLFSDVLTGEHLQHRLYFTCKPTRSDALLRQAAHLGSWVDVSSAGELQAALAAGVAGHKLSATGPKNGEYLKLAAQHQALVVADNPHELQCLAALAQAGQPVMLRLSSPAAGATLDDTFGFAAAELPAAFARLKALPQLTFMGVACHTSGADSIRQQQIEQAVAATLAAFAAGLAPTALNIGGGYKTSLVNDRDWQDFMHHLKQAVLGEGEAVTWENTGMGLRRQDGRLAGSPAFIDHFEPVTGEHHLEKVLLAPVKAAGDISLADFIRDTGLTLYIEPGRALVDQAGLTLARVNFTRRSAQRHLLVNLDMHHGNLNAHAFKYLAEPVILAADPTKGESTDEGVFYYGSLCFAGDLITFHKTFPGRIPQPGDIAVFANTAAYRMDFAESAILRHPTAAKVALYKQGGSWRWTLDNAYLPDTLSGAAS
jgi:diaminopimelate decarboxylase